MGDVIAFPRSLLWREAVGHELRRERLAQERTQGDVAGAAGISTQYLSEVERGRKEPSSEILEAALGALELDLSTLANRVAELTGSAAPADPVTVRSHPTGPVLLAA